MADLLDPEAGLVGEYDGEGHRELDRHVLDNAREEWFEDAGLVVVRACSPTCARPTERRSALRLRSAYPPRTRP